MLMGVLQKPLSWGCFIFLHPGWSSPNLGPCNTRKPQTGRIPLGFSPWVYLSKSMLFSSLPDTGHERWVCSQLGL